MSVSVEDLAKEIYVNLLKRRPIIGETNHLAWDAFNAAKAFIYVREQVFQEMLNKEKKG